MFSVARGTTLVSPLGPRRVEDLGAGTQVLGVRAGSPVWLELESVTENTVVEGYHLFHDSGDIILSDDTRVVTSRGLQGVADIWALRRGGDIGRVGQGLPALELAQSYAHLAGAVARNARALAEMVAEVVRAASRGGVMRVSSSRANLMQALLRTPKSSRIEVVHGPASWSWLVPGGVAHVDLGDQISTDMLPTVVESCWQQGDSVESLALPESESLLRWLSFDIWRLLGVPFSCDWRPAYSPSSVCVTLRTPVPILAKLQSIAPKRNVRIYGVRNAGPPALVCAGGILVESSS